MGAERTGRFRCSSSVHPKFLNGSSSEVTGLNVNEFHTDCPGIVGTNFHETGYKFEKSAGDVKNLRFIIHLLYLWNYAPL